MSKNSWQLKFDFNLLLHYLFLSIFREKLNVKELLQGNFIFNLKTYFYSFSKVCNGAIGITHSVTKLTQSLSFYL